MKYSFSITRLPFALLLALLAVAHSCKETAPSAPTKQEPPLPPQPIQTISLTVVDSASVEAWLKLSMPDTVKERRYRLYLNDSLIWQATLTKPDTLMLLGDYLGSKPFRLSPSTTYRTRIERLTADTFNINVDEKSFRTLDTTSQDYAWTVQTVGIGFGGVLRDVCLINDSCIWAVGRIDSGLYDSLGVPIVYNAMRYDGHQWHYYRLMTATRVLFPQGGGDDSLFSEGWSVFGTSETNVFIAAGAFFEKTPTGWRQTRAETAGGANKLWKNGENIYAVGNNGYIAHFDGTTWRRMESGTTAHLIDIYGTPDGESVWVAGYTNAPALSVILSLQNGQWKTLWSKGQHSSLPYRNVYSLWTAGGSEFAVMADVSAYFHSRLAPMRTRFQTDLHVGVGWCVRGSGRNNLAVAGTFGNMWHYNGIRWMHYTALANPSDWYRGIAVGQNIIVAVGERGGSALIAIGRKQP